MIFIVVKFPVLAQRSEGWLSLVADFTEATRSEPGNIFFEWSRSVEDPNEFVLIEAFRDAAAGAAHVSSEHFQNAMATLPAAIAATPRIVNVEVPGDGWSQMAELQPRNAS
jgi:quinol monooxygenase YgiN